MFAIIKVVLYGVFMAAVFLEAELTFCLFSNNFLSKHVSLKVSLLPAKVFKLVKDIELRHYASGRLT